MLNRALQNELLRLAEYCHPAFCRFKFKEIDSFNIKYPLIFSSSKDELWREVKYLEGHGLLILDSTCSQHPGIEGIIGYMQATVKGIDFILNDGGLSAVLNVQTIKFHRDTVVVLEDLIAISSMSSAEREKAKSKLDELSSEALKTVVQAATTALLGLGQ